VLCSFVMYVSVFIHACNSAALNDQILMKFDIVS
jgi:hypothetical protein